MKTRELIGSHELVVGVCGVNRVVASKVTVHRKKEFDHFDHLEITYKFANDKDVMI